MADTGVVVVRQCQTRHKGPLLPFGIGTSAAEQPLVGQYQQARNKVQSRVQVNLKGCQHVLIGMQLRCHILTPRGRNITGQGLGGDGVRIHWAKTGSCSSVGSKRHTLRYSAWSTLHGR